MITDEKKKLLALHKPGCGHNIERRTYDDHS